MTTILLIALGVFYISGALATAQLALDGGLAKNCDRWPKGVLFGVLIAACWWALLPLALAIAARHRREQAAGPAPVCADCVHLELRPERPLLLYGQRHTELCALHTEPVNGTPIPALYAREYDRWCGREGKNFIPKRSDA